MADVWHTRTLAVKVERLDHETGLWCNTCMLSTGMRFWFTITLGPRMHVQERLWCYEHEGSRGVVVDADHH